MQSLRPVTALLAAFGVFGILFGAWQVLLPDLARELELTPGPLGAALSVGFVASLPAMVVAGRLADRIGPRRLALSSGAGLALSFAAFAAARDVPVLVACVLAFLAASGAYDVGINAAAIDHEQASGGRRLLPLLHASFSGGGALGAIVAGWLLAGQPGFRLGYAAVAVGIGAVLVAWATVRGEPRHAAVAGAGSGSARLFTRPVLLLLASITALAFLSEGAMETWSAIYLRGTLDVTPLVGAAGVAVFHGAMLVGRLTTATLTGRLGRRLTLRAAGVLAALAMLGALVTDLPGLAIGGFLFVGIALASVAPLAFSLAGDADPARAGQVSAVITTIGYAGFLLGPALIGGVAELASLRLALGVVVVAGVLIALLGGQVPRE